MTDDARWSAKHMEADFDALMDLGEAARTLALAQIERVDPGRAQALRRWLGAVSASAGLLEEVGAASAPGRIERVGPWQLEGLIGRGGSGEVHLGRRADGAFERQVAVKLLRADRNADARIVEERRLLARLDHPHIARLLDGGVAPDGRPWLVTEFISGRPLDRWIEEATPDLERRLKAFTALTDAVAHAHANGIVHADLKPANVLIDANDQPHLLDFGIARLLEPTATPGQGGSHGLTPAWTAPEQLDGTAADRRSDVYALGLLCYLLLTGAPPIDPQAHSLSELKALRQQHDPPPPSRRAAAREAAHIRGGLDALVLRCLARDPAQRPADARALLAGLRAAQRRTSVIARRRPSLAGWLALLAMSTLLAWALWQHARIQDLEARLEQLERAGGTGYPAVD